jgi:hypothetical protein
MKKVAIVAVTYPRHTECVQGEQKTKDAALARSWPVVGTHRRHEHCGPPDGSPIRIERGDFAATVLEGIHARGTEKRYQCG